MTWAMYHTLHWNCNHMPSCVPYVVALMISKHGIIGKQNSCIFVLSVNPQKSKKYINESLSILGIFGKFNHSEFFELLLWGFQISNSVKLDTCIRWNFGEISLCFVHKLHLKICHACQNYYKLLSFVTVVYYVRAKIICEVKTSYECVPNDIWDKNNSI